MERVMFSYLILFVFLCLVVSLYCDNIKFLSLYFCHLSDDLMYCYPFASSIVTEKSIASAGFCVKFAFVFFIVCDFYFVVHFMNIKKFFASLLSAFIVLLYQIKKIFFLICACLFCVSMLEVKYV